VIRYSVLRLLIFFGVLAALWLVGLRDRDEQVLLLVLAAAISMLISFFALRRFRDDYSQEINDRLTRRAEARRERAQVRDEAAEDAEDEGSQGPVEYR
jgi:hypothetical protein